MGNPKPPNKGANNSNNSQCHSPTILTTGHSHMCTWFLMFGCRKKVCAYVLPKNSKAITKLIAKKLDDQYNPGKKNQKKLRSFWGDLKQKVNLRYKRKKQYRLEDDECRILNDYQATKLRIMYEVELNIRQQVRRKRVTSRHVSKQVRGEVFMMANDLMYLDRKNNNTTNNKHITNDNSSDDNTASMKGMALVTMEQIPLIKTTMIQITTTMIWMMILISRITTTTMY